MIDADIIVARKGIVVVIVPIPIEINEMNDPENVIILEDDTDIE